MKMTLKIFTAAAVLFLFGCSQKPAEETKSQDRQAKLGVKYAVIKTSKGKIVAKLFGDQAPKAVANFIGLATGSKTWIDPRNGKTMNNTPLYNGISFHRVIPGFMAQTGDPLGDGRGNVGYTFEDEFDKSLRFDKPGMLGMANAGPATNGSQFFITAAPTPHLNDYHTIFGEVVEGLDVVQAIVSVPRDMDPGSYTPDKPLKPVLIENITIQE